MKAFWKYFIALFLCCSQFTWAQTTFEATVSRTEIPLNENVRVDFSMNSDGDHFSPPRFEGFQVVGGPNQSVSYSWVNGKKTFNKTYSYFLSPTRKGSLTIGSATIQIDNQTYTTDPIKVTVTDAVKKEDPRTRLNHSQEKALKGIHLVAEISNTSPYVNEPITVVYKLYVSPYSNVVGYNGTQVPQYKNFWVNSIDLKDLKVEMGKYQGEDYRYVVLKKDILMAQEAGEQVLEPLVLDIQCEVPTGRRDFFGFPEIGYMTQSFTTGSRKINVKPLPDHDKPEDFSGAVGKFDFKATPSVTEIKAGEPLHLEVEISGRGNMNLFSLPDPEAPAALEIYDPEYTEKLNPGLWGLQGNKKNKYTVIPQYKGEYTIRPMRFSYFDLDTKTYKTIETQEIPIHVLEGPTLPTHKESSGLAQTEADVFQPLEAELNIKTPKTKDFWKSPSFYILFSMPILAIPLFLLLVNYRREKANDQIGNQLRRNKRLAKKYLSEARKNLKNKELFYEALERCLHNFLKAKLKLETSEMSNDHIRELLDEKGVAPTSVEAFMNVKETCEYARYTPTSQVDMKKDYDKAVVVISELEKQFK